MPAHAKLAAWKSDIETNFVNLFESLPAAPAIREGERISPFLGMLQLPNQSRTVVTSGLAMIGDAALASDPAWGVGYGWALQSAEWLVDCAAEALRHGRDLEASLAAYRRRHRRQLAGHNFLIAEFASGWGFNPIEKLMLDGTAPPSGPSPPRRAQVQQHSVRFGCCWSWSGWSGTVLHPGLSFQLTPSASFPKAPGTISHSTSRTAMLRKRYVVAVSKPASRINRLQNQRKDDVCSIRSKRGERTMGDFTALGLHEAAGGIEPRIERVDETALPAGDVTVAVEYSTLNYKDGLILNGLGRLVSKYPHVGGIDFAGTVERSKSPDFRPGDKVVLTGWRVGEVQWGGYAQKARVKASMLVRLPDELTGRRAMAIGTAGFTAMLAVMQLERHGSNAGGGGGAGDWRRRWGRQRCHRHPGAAGLSGCGLHGAQHDA